MFAAGFIVYLGFLLIMVKLPVRAQLWLIGHSLLLDLVVSVTAYMLHRGTYTGVMVAALAGLLCALTTTAAKYAFGYLKNGKYVPGRIWIVDLPPPKPRAKKTAR